MRERIEQEIALLRTRYPDLVYREEGGWVLLPSYPVSPGWNRTASPVAFQILPGFPGTPSYSFYVPTGIEHGGTRPNNYVDPAPNQPPFAGGPWGVFSWSHTEDWRPTADPRTGCNLLNWVIGFAQRFLEGI
jgi:hypothetical protein